MQSTYQHHISNQLYGVNPKLILLHLFTVLTISVSTFRYNTLLQQRNKLEELEKNLKEEQVKMAMEKEQHRTIAAECCRLRDEKDW